MGAHPAGYAFAFTNRNFPAAAALSIILLVITLAIGLVIVTRSGLFGDDRVPRIKKKDRTA